MSPDLRLLFGFGGRGWGFSHCAHSPCCCFTGPQKRYASSPYSDEIVVQVTPAQQQEEPEMLWVTGPVLAVILIILIVIAILLFKR